MHEGLIEPTVVPRNALDVLAQQIVAIAVPAELAAPAAAEARAAQSARKGSRQLAIANAGRIPDRGLYAVMLPDGLRAGELDEEMV
jgi:ATP-dependent Lhr-like helicase